MHLFKIGERVWTVGHLTGSTLKSQLTGLAVGETLKVDLIDAPDDFRERRFTVTYSGEVGGLPIKEEPTPYTGLGVIYLSSSGFRAIPPWGSLVDMPVTGQWTIQYEQLKSVLRRVK